MKERNDCMKKIRDETKEHMLRSVVNPTNLSYRNALKNLIIQVFSFLFLISLEYD
jgi:hypothetical protein